MNSFWWNTGFSIFQSYIVKIVSKTEIIADKMITFMHDKTMFRAPRSNLLLTRVQTRVKLILFAKRRQVFK